MEFKDTRKLPVPPDFICGDTIAFSGSVLRAYIKSAPFAPLSTLTCEDVPRTRLDRNGYTTRGGTNMIVYVNARWRRVFCIQTSNVPGYYVDLSRDERQLYGLKWAFVSI